MILFEYSVEPGFINGTLILPIFTSTIKTPINAKPMERSSDVLTGVPKKRG